MNKRHLTALAGTAIAALTMSACSSGDGGDSAEPEPTEKTTPSILIPEVSDGNTIPFKIDPHGLDQGTSVRVGVYGGGFGDEAPTCEEEVEDTEVVIGDGQARGSIAVKEPGRYQVVMSTDGFASPCDDPNATTTVKTQPDIFLDGDLESDGPGTYGAKQGEPFSVAVSLDGQVPKGTKMPVTLTAYGPYSTEPELRADQCNDDKAAAETVIDWTGGKLNRAKNPYTSASMTLDGTKGLYLIKAKTEGSEAVSATETDCENFQSVLKVSTKDGAAEPGASSTASSTSSASPKPSGSATKSGTNALTGNRDAEGEK